ncbi:putative peptidase S49, ClpP/crotonase-like domain superfamily [Helianthus annuus]|nr:putative peptidase S49, ClpP/crotonase-like domain superfamily [Helianthus annuus]
MATPDVLSRDHFSSSSPFNPTKGDALEKKKKEEIESFINEGVYQIEKLKEDGWITDDDEVKSMLKTRIAEKKKLPLIDYKKWSVGLSGGKDRIAVIRASGSIGPVGLIAEQFIKMISKIQKGIRRLSSELIALRFDGLASDLLWREIKLLAESKPVVASMVDMAGSGGYQMAMAANAIVSENLTLTGSIDVVSCQLQFLKMI